MDRRTFLQATAFLGLSKAGFENREEEQQPLSIPEQPHEIRLKSAEIAFDGKTLKAYEVVLGFSHDLAVPEQFVEITLYHACGSVSDFRSFCETYGRIRGVEEPAPRLTIIGYADNIETHFAFDHTIWCKDVPENKFNVVTFIGDKSRTMAGKLVCLGFMAKGK